jgi:hypothetical protein
VVGLLWFFGLFGKLHKLFFVGGRSPGVNPVMGKVAIDPMLVSI